MTAFDAEANYILAKRSRDEYKRSSESILSEYLKLVEVASRLETYLSNRNEPRRSFQERFSQHVEIDEAESVKEEAQLLISLMTSFPHNKTQREGNRVKTDADNTGFSFRCPSLSLQHSSSALANRSSPEEPESQENCHSPPQLFARPLVTRAWDDIKQVAEKMAANTMQSFIAALEWRAREWVKSLAKVLFLKHKPILDLQKSPNDEQSFYRSVAATKEALVIESIALAAQDINVRDIRATVNVLEQQVDHHDVHNLVNPHKKRKISNDSYRVSHAVSLDLRLTISTDPHGSIDHVDLAVPGVIHGTFIKRNGEVQLVEADVNVDTEALALVVEKKCRIVLRTVAESHLSRSSKSSPSQDDEDLRAEDVDELNNLIESNRNEIKNTYTLECVHTQYPTAVLVTPRKHNVSVISNTSSDNEDPHAPPSSMVHEDDLFFNQQNKFQTMNRVSPTLCHTFDQRLSSSPTPGTSPEISSCTTTDPPQSNMMIPSLVSPNPCTRTEENSTNVHALKLRSLNGRGPSLPALVEVACAAMNAP